MSETWLAVPGWEGLYEVSDHGRVRSVPRRVRSGNGAYAVRGGRVLKTATSRGYEHVSLSNGSVKRNARVHVLVASAHLGLRPGGTHACHIDGDSHHNEATNLYWGTPLENIHDKRRHGTNTYALRRGACRHGHAYTPASTYISKVGSPVCRTCRNESARKGKKVAS